MSNTFIYIDKLFFNQYQFISPNSSLQFAQRDEKVDEVNMQKGHSIVWPWTYTSFFASFTAVFMSSYWGYASAIVGNSY